LPVTPLVQRGGQAAAGVARQRMLYAQLVEDSDHHAANIVARSVGARERGEQQIQRPLVLAGVESGERLVQIGNGRLRGALGCPLKADARGQPVGGETPGNPRQDRERVIDLPAGMQDPGQGDRGVGPRRLELVSSAQRLFVAALDEHVGLGGKKRVQKPLDRGRRLRSDELGDDLAVPERLDGRNALDPEGARDARVRIDVDLRQLELAGSLAGGPLEHGTKLPARAAPARPEVDHDRERVGTVEDRGLEVRLGDVHASDGSDAAAPGNLTSTSISPDISAPEDPSILVEGLVVRFEQLVAVAGVSFAVRPGEAFGLLGPNGAGKTTTVRVLATLLRASEGRALVAGYDVQRQGLEVRASIGYIPQALSADGALTARENLEFYARVTGVPRAIREERIAEAVEAMEIGGWLDRLARTLSGGMLRRLEIGTALLGRPRVLLLDEPTVGLDPNARRVVWERLHALRRQAGTTILVTTHLMEEAERHCERLAIMDHGRLVAEGAPSELIAAHDADGIEDVFVAVTGRTIEEGGRIRDVKRQRRIARRLG
jgi:ABC-2 type transport system ATP-binding protein